MQWHLRIMEVRDLFEVVEDVVLVIADLPGNFVVRVVDELDVVVDDQLQVPAEFLLSFNQLTNDGSVLERKNYISFILALESAQLWRHLLPAVRGIICFITEHGLIGVHNVQYRNRYPTRFGIVVPVEDSYFPPVIGR